MTHCKLVFAYNFSAKLVLLVGWGRVLSNQPKRRLTDYRNIRINILTPTVKKPVSELRGNICL